MLKRALHIAPVLFALGCSPDMPSANVDGVVPYNDSLKPLVGTWSSQGEPALIVENQGDRLLIRNPLNDTRRFEITDTTVEGDSIRFKQRNYLVDGQDHPFSDMECKVEISAVAGDPDGLRYSVTTPQMPKAQTEVFRRVEQ